MPQLKLLVDLDNTLIHSRKESVNRFPLCGDVIWMSEQQRILKIRPYTFDFLEAMAERYEMTVVTLGKRSYAEAIVGHLDPEHTFFGGRIIAREDLGDLRSKTKKLDELFPGGMEQTAIIDDRVDVWDFRENVVQVLPYHFFRNLDDRDNSLEHMKRVLIEVHRRFHEHFAATQELLNLKEVIRQYKREVLRGNTVVLVDFPLYMKIDLIALLMHFGAQGQNDVDAKTTVVVTNLTNPDEKNVPVVTEEWIREVERTWAKPDFGQFSFEMMAAKREAEEQHHGKRKSKQQVQKQECSYFKRLFSAWCEVV